MGFFCDKWRNFIHGCLCNVIQTCECLWMVCHMGTFQLLEGCDKGSKPSLLILAEEVLSRGLQELVSLKMITPYHASRSCPALSHFLFANDVIILYNSHKRNLKKLQIFLKKSQLKTVQPRSLVWFHIKHCPQHFACRRGTIQPLVFLWLGNCCS